FYNPTPPPHTHTLSLHDALPISIERGAFRQPHGGEEHALVLRRQEALGRRLEDAESGDADADHHHGADRRQPDEPGHDRAVAVRSEEHTSELQSRSDLVCRLLLE